MLTNITQGHRNGTIESLKLPLKGLRDSTEVSYHEWSREGLGVGMEASLKLTENATSSHGQSEPEMIWQLSGW